MPEEAAKPTGPVYSPHPYAEIFPPMDGETYVALIADIKASGLLEPITINARNQILDGLNRFRACSAAGVAPRFERKDLKDGEVLPFIMSRNVHRRHMTTAQRAAAAAAVVKITKDGPANLRVSQAAAAKLFNISERAVHEALGVLEQAPELHEAALAGDVSTHLSGQLANLPKTERDQALAKLKDGDKKAAHVLVNAASPQVKKSPAKKKPSPTSVPRKAPSSTFKGSAVYAPLFAELDQLADNLGAYPLSRSQAQALVAELHKAIERIENTTKATLSL